MTQFNPQQQLAIDALNQNIIVSASAGAGKTTVLIARLMKRILEDGVRIDQICAMTFTEAAASEMKTRLLTALNATYQKQPSDFIAEQIALVETAQISTIHSFCLTIIKNYGYILGIDPSRADTILDDASVRLYQKQAWDDTLNHWLLQKTDVTQGLLDLFSNNPIDFDSLGRAVQAIAGWLQSKKDPTQAIALTQHTYRANSLEDLPEVYQFLFFNTHKQAIQSLKTHIMSLIALADNCYDANDKKQAKFIQQNQILTDVVGQLIAFEQQIDNKDASFYDTILEVCNIKIAPDGKNEDYTALRALIVKDIDGLVKEHRPLSEHFKLIQSQYCDVTNLLEMTQAYLHAYEAIKLAKNCLDFSDFESLALRILSANDFEIATMIQPRYEEIMVDEFQDTNEYQDEIIRLISKGDNIFRVGDVKQSIYRFRGAKPHIMQNLMQSDGAKNLYLSFNYRSKRDIVEYNNAVFDNLMNLTPGMSYSKHDHVDIGIPQQSIDSFPVTFHIINRLDNSSGFTGPQLQARYIAQKIIEFHQQGYQFKDMVILARAHAPKTELKRVFEAVNIPHYLDDRSGFYNSDVVEDVLNMLNYALNHHDYYLVLVLKSVFIGLSDNQIAHLRLQDLSLKEALAHHHPQVYATLFNTIKTWRHKDIVSVIQDLMLINNVYNQTLSLQDKTNLDFLLEKAVQYQSQATPTLFGFIQFVSALNNDKSSEGSPLGDDEDVVTAMTIHQSKGLQFPIVFLWGSGPLSVLDHRHTYLTDDMAGLSLNTVTMPYRITEKSLLRDLTEKHQYLEEVEEQLRLLYVALTRPQQHLLILDCVKAFQEVPLNFELLVSGARPSELLYAASPASTQLFHIDPEAIVLNPLPNVSTQTTATYEHGFQIPVEPIVPTKATALNLDKYSEEGMAFGSMLHKAIEHLPAREWQAADLAHLDPIYRSPLQAYNLHPKTLELYSYPIIEHEMPFITQDEEGIIDFYAQNDREIVIVDFKSDNTSLETLKERYTHQLMGYVEAMRHSYPQLNVSAFIYSFKNEDYILITDS